MQNGSVLVRFFASGAWHLSRADFAVYELRTAALLFALSLSR
ncbi:MAG: hypothetical protein ABI456_19305 [Ktedonobacteraceae bacterium]